MIPFPIIIAIIVVLYILSSVKILRDYERGVIFRLGRLLTNAKGPGIILVFVPVDRMVRISLRQEALEVPPQDIITRDNVTLKVNAVIFAILDTHTAPWGVKVANVEVKQVDMPESMLRAMAKQAEAEREKRSKIIHAEGEFSAAQRLVDAAKLLATEPVSVQLRYLQTLTEIGVEKNTTVVFPVPVDIFSRITKPLEKSEASAPVPAKP